MGADRGNATAAGILYFVTHVASIAGLVLYGPVLGDRGYVTGGGADAQIFWGALLEVVTAVAVVGTAVALFPVAKRVNEGIALGYVGLRVLEAGVIVVGIVALLSVVTLRQEAAGADGLVAVGAALVAVHDWTFLLGPNFVLGVNTVLMAYLMYRSRLVPRVIPVLGLVGGPLVFGSAVAVLFGVYEQVSGWGVLTAVPVFAWELGFAGWMVFKGFRARVPGPREESVTALSA
ncbi:DUF4386 domain-containing protein [Sphaerisporangium sp. B11E5]|uniref:DUF4386 domain-containing protein n=1 Tax=Sphaerisporangium sp. B11E5 TaxID=3153563 RepID=UPI00325D854A